MSHFTVTLRPGFLARSVALVVVPVSPDSSHWTVRARDNVGAFHPVRFRGQPLQRFLTRGDAAAFLTDNGAPATVWAVAETRPYVRPAIGRAVETGVAQCFAA